MYDVFTQDPTYGIKNPEEVFMNLGPEFLGLWFEIQEAAEKQGKIFFLDHLPEDFSEMLESEMIKIYGWLIPYEQRQGFHDPWINSNEYILNNFWKDNEGSVSIIRNGAQSLVDFNIYSEALPEDLLAVPLESAKSFKKIDIEKWNRREHYNKYKDAIIPNYSIVVDVDITEFLKRIKERKLSFTLSMAYIIAKALNQVQEFKYRIKDDEVVLYEQIDPVIRYLNKDTGLFKDTKVPLLNSLSNFVKLAEQLIEEQEDAFVDDGDLGIINFSSTPWFSFKAISPIVEGTSTGTPMIVWGQYEEIDGRTILPLSIEAHHAFVDGYHIAQFLDVLQEELNSY